MARRTVRVCSVPGCPAFTDGGKCREHRRSADRARGTAAERGYTSPAWYSVRRLVLRRDRTCVVCHSAPSTVADHYPTSRRDLLLQKVADPDAPHRLRGLCAPCHGRETAIEQPGGWNLPG